MLISLLLSGRSRYNPTHSFIALTKKVHLLVYEIHGIASFVTYSNRRRTHSRQSKFSSVNETQTKLNIHTTQYSDNQMNWYALEIAMQCNLCFTQNDVNVISVCNFCYSWYLFWTDLYTYRGQSAAKCLWKRNLFRK